MLIPAALVADKLAEARRQAMISDLDRFRWYRMGTGTSWLHEAIDPSHGDWDAIQRASVRIDVDGPWVLGFCGARMDRDTGTCEELAAWSAYPGNLTYLRDLRAFCDDVLRRVLVLRFRVAADNPARRGWARWAASHGGGELCTLSSYGRGADGRLLDAVLYQVPGQLTTTAG